MIDADSQRGRYLIRGGESWRSPWDDYRWLRDQDPVHRCDHHDLGYFYVLSRFEDVFDAVRDTATFSSARGLTLLPHEMDSFAGQALPIVMMDPPAHTEIRRLVSGPMIPRRVAPIEQGITEFIEARLDMIADLGDAEVDIIDMLFKPLPSLLVAHYLGVPVKDRDRFDAWTNVIVAANAEGGPADSAAAFTELFEYASHLVERRRVAPGEDLVSILAGSGADGVDVMWIVGFVFTMITGGNDTTTGLLGGAADLLTVQRDERRRLIGEPKLVRPSVNEFLRLTSPVQNLARTTTRDVTIRDVTVPAGRKVMLLYGSANRDEREFGPRAGTLDVGRSIPRLVSFGYGAHHCLGAAVARLAAGVALERLLLRFPDFEADGARGHYAPGWAVRRFAGLPFRATP